MSNSAARAHNLLRNRAWATPRLHAMLHNISMYDITICASILLMKSEKETGTKSNTIHRYIRVHIQSLRSLIDDVYRCSLELPVFSNFLTRLSCPLNTKVHAQQSMIDCSNRLLVFSISASSLACLTVLLSRDQ